MSLKEKLIRCGRKDCPSCPHGPYLYQYYWQDGKTKCRYVGKMSIAEYLRSGQDPVKPGANGDVDPSKLREIKGNYFVALTVLGLVDDQHLTREVARKRHFGIVHKKGVSAIVVDEANASFHELCVNKGWKIPRALKGYQHAQERKEDNE